ncbi:sensor histidine kinase, partial [Sphingomonas bacterium]|uniref:sensor histidine kinase n=1 Tax=Sphingomonas bacterium TaxID=1895847 RepID=UPI0020C61103
ASSDWLFHPLAGGRGVLAVLGLARDDGGEPLRSDQMGLLMGLLDQAGVALDRLRLEGEARRVVAVEERDRLRAALLSSVGHDLRTPLTAIVAAAAELDESAGPALVADIRNEAERLRRFVANLLDMVRIEAGAIQLVREPTDLTDAVASAAQDVRRTLGDHQLTLDVSPRLPLVSVDPRLLHHCLINLLDNAGRYAEAGTPITVSAERRPGALTLAIIDEGPGLPPGREATVFETFRRLEGSDRSSGGTGLGLAIVKGFAEAMGLAVDAANRHDRRGACFAIVFPEALLVTGVMEA